MNIRPNDDGTPTKSDATLGHKPQITWLVLGDRMKASSRVRAYWLEEELSALGWHSDFLLGEAKIDLLKAISRLERTDVLVIQKLYSKWHLALVRIARAFGCRVVFDIDDFPSVENRPKTVRYCEKVMSSVDLVVAGSQELAIYAGKFNRTVGLVPSTIKLNNYPISRSDLAGPSNESVIPLTLGWIGNGKYYGADLVDILEEPLRRSAADAPLRLILIGISESSDAARVFRSIEGLQTEIVESIDWSKPDATAKALEGVDVGLYPLRETLVNRHKCGFKGLEYMALALPVVASDHPAHRDLFRDGVDGILCAEPAEWYEALTMLRQRHLRTTMGMNGREQVEKLYSTERAARLWVELLRRVRLDPPLTQ